MTFTIYYKIMIIVSIIIFPVFCFETDSKFKYYSRGAQEGVSGIYSSASDLWEVPYILLNTPTTYEFSTYSRALNIADQISTKHLSLEIPTRVHQIKGVQVIPERAKVVYMNKKYFHNYTFDIRRYSRKGGYLINIEATLKQQWTNNVSVHLVFYEYLHNEYRRSFIELHYKYCDLLSYEKVFAPTLLTYGITCPLPIGTYRFTNMTVPMDNFPNVFPFEKARMDVENTFANESMVLIQFYASFKNKIPRK